MQKTRINELITQAFIAKELFTIDPGKTNGGIVKFKDNKFETWPLKKMIDVHDLTDFWKYQAEICELPLVVLESINTFNSDVENIGRMHRLNKLKDHYVELKTALKLSKIQFIEIMPSSWQRYINVFIAGEDYQVRKSRYKDIASDWFPGQKIVGWNADAFLMIEFIKRKLKYDQRWILNKLKGKPETKSLFK